MKEIRHFKDKWYNTLIEDIIRCNGHCTDIKSKCFEHETQNKLSNRKAAKMRNRAWKNTGRMGSLEKTQMERFHWWRGHIK
jgi:hypothetical protein